MLNTTVIIVNYKTPLLIKICYESLRRFYPEIPVILMDNASQDASTEYIKKQESENTTVFVYKRNVGHGPALHKGTMEAKTRYVFTLDADCEVLRGGFIEEMEQQLADSEAYVIGESWEERYGPYIHPYAMLMKRGVYKTLPRFKHGGAPASETQREACKRGLKVIDFLIADYVRHGWQGSRSFYNWHGRGKRLADIMKVPGEASAGEVSFLVQALKVAPAGWLVGATDSRGAAAVCLSMGRRKAKLNENVVVLTPTPTRIGVDLAKLDLRPRISSELPNDVESIAALFLDFGQEISVPEWVELVSVLVPSGVVAVLYPNLHPEQAWYSSKEWEFLGRERGAVAFRRKK